MQNVKIAPVQLLNDYVDQYRARNTILYIKFSQYRILNLSNEPTILAICSIANCELCGILYRYSLQYSVLTWYAVCPA